LTIWPLNAISLIFKTLSLIDFKIKSRKRKRFPEASIISIDNLSFGGTGKTPLVIETAEHLEKNRIKFAIITRGYRSKFESRGTKVQALHTVEDVGDEAKLFKERFPRQDIYIGKDRQISIEKAIAGGNRVILLDDGFQTAALEKDVKIMLINPQHPYYYLRNFKFMMKKEDYILFYRSGGEGETVGNPAAGTNGDHSALPLSSTGPVYGTYDFKIQGFRNTSGEAVNIDDVPLLGFSALGDNLRFKRDLSVCDLVEFRGFRDHYSFTEEDLEWLNERRIQKKAHYLVCTEKDYMKIKHYNLSLIPLIYSQNSIKFSFDLMGRVLKRCRNKK